GDVVDAGECRANTLREPLVVGHRRHPSPFLEAARRTDYASRVPDRLGERFDAALVYAVDLHHGQARKGRNVPYASHLLGVTSLVIEEDGTEDQAIAALLHDAVEDQGGMPTLLDIRARFGDHVGDIVEACTDSFEDPKPPWRERKEAYVAHLPE